MLCFAWANLFQAIAVLSTYKQILNIENGLFSGYDLLRAEAEPEQKLAKEVRPHAA